MCGIAGFAGLGDPGINHSFVERAWRAHRTGQRDHRLLLWCWLSLLGVATSNEPYRMAARPAPRMQQRPPMDGR